MAISDKEIRDFLKWQGSASTNYSLMATYDDVECARGHSGLGMLLSVAGVTVGAFYCPVCNRIEGY